MEHVTSLKSNVQKLAQREEEAYQQTKKGIEMVEQAQLEQTQVKTTSWFTDEPSTCTGTHISEGLLLHWQTAELFP